MSVCLTVEEIIFHSVVVCCDGAQERENEGGKRDDDADDEEGKEANVSEKRKSGRFFSSFSWLRHGVEICARARRVVLQFFTLLCCVCFWR